MDKILLRLATFGGIGFLPGAPGTWASAATALLWLAITCFLLRKQFDRYKKDGKLIEIGRASCRERV